MKWNSDLSQRLGARKTPLSHIQLSSLVERDETPEGGPQPNLDTNLSSPAAPMDNATENRLNEMSAIKTPKTLPRLAHAEMHPKEVHRTTTTAPDSGLHFGFADIPPGKVKHTIAEAQNTPSRTAPRASLPQHLTAPSFDFKFASESNLSDEAQKLMDHVREDAEKFKQHILAEQINQARKDGEAERLFGGLNATGRKIAKAQGRAGRFSDVHMAQFKKMDSIANHPSSFRAKPSFTQPTQQSLKRSGSKAGLDERERPRTAGKDTPGRQPPPLTQANRSSSTHKPPPNYMAESSRLENDAPAKRRKSTFGDVSTSRIHMKEDDDIASKPSTLPRPKFGLPRSLLTPTKASLARSNTGKPSLASPSKVSLLPRSNSTKSLKAAIDQTSSSDGYVPPSSPPKQLGLVRSESTKSIRPLPPLPTNAFTSPTKSPSKFTTSKPLPAVPILTSSPSKPSLSSRLPTLQGLKSILRPNRHVASKIIESPTKDMSAGVTPKRNNTAPPSESGSTKKVDFTPSTKSRYAVKLAAGSPSPSKLPAASSSCSSGPIVPYDPAAYTLDDESNDEWEDAESEIEYPILPTLDDKTPSTPLVAPIITRNFAQKAKAHTHRESNEFKSIFTTLEHPSRSNTPTTLTAVNTKPNIYGAGAGVIPHHQNRPAPPNIIARSPGNTTTKASPSTIRRVRSSGVSNLIQPFEDTIKTIPHGLAGKKRRRDFDDDGNDDETKENRNTNTNRRFSTMASVPGAWKGDSILAAAAAGHDDDHDDVADEGVKRGGKRAKIEPRVRASSAVAGMGNDAKANANAKIGGGGKKLNKAREAAKRSAEERKEGGRGGLGGAAGAAAKKGILSMSRLNVLSRPKERR